MDNKNTPIMMAIDFFCGVGGMTCGLSQAGITVLAGIDIDEKCKQTYEENNPYSTFIQCDVHKLSEEELSSLTGIDKNDDSLIFIACSPCQYWTEMKTKREKSKSSKDLLKEFKRFVSYFRPGYIILENVPGFYRNIDRNVLGEFIEFLNSLEEHSYHYDHGVINANHYGVPQNRKRYVLVASRLGPIKLPDEKHYLSYVVRDFIGPHNGFMEIEAGTKDPTDFMHSAAMLTEININRIRKTPPNGGTRLSWKNDPELQLKAYIGKDRDFPDIYGRMYWDKPAPTITTKFYSLTNGRFGHPKEHRAISLREGATLQTFPKDYVFRGTSIASIAKMIGNAVPPEMAKKIGQVIVGNYKNAYVSN